jgi:hypothetical protein
MKRFYNKMLKDDIRQKTVWTFFDFNSAPSDDKMLYEWVMKSFIEQIETNMELHDLNIRNEYASVFANEIKRKQPIYDELKSINEDDYKKAYLNDVSDWLKNDENYMTNLARYISGDKGIPLEEDIYRNLNENSD